MESESMEHDGSGREDDDGSEDDAWIEDDGEEEVEKEVNASDIHTNEREDSNLSSAGTHNESEELEPGDKDKVFTAISFSVEEATTKDDNAMSGKTMNPEGHKEVKDAVDFSVEEGGATSNDSSVISDKTMNLRKHKEMEGASIAPVAAVPMDTSEDASGIKDKSIDPETSEEMGALDDLQPKGIGLESQENLESPKEQVQGQGQSKPSSSKVCRTLSNTSASSSSSLDETTDLGEEFCATCYQGFNSVGEWCDHLSSHSVASLNLRGIPGKRHWSLTCATCTMCKKVFPVVFNKPGPFKCKICMKLFPDKSSANEHIEAQTRSQEQLGESKAAAQQEQVVFKCNLCLKGYTSLEGLMKHFSCDHKSFSCQICMKVVQDWESHMERFHKDDSKLVENKRQIKDLLRTLERCQKKDALQPCLFCQESFDSFISLSNHAREAHAEIWKLWGHKQST